MLFIGAIMDNNRLLVAYEMFLLAVNKRLSMVTCTNHYLVVMETAADPSSAVPLPMDSSAEPNARTELARLLVDSR